MLTTLVSFHGRPTKAVFTPGNRGQLLIEYGDGQAIAFHVEDDMVAEDITAGINAAVTKQGKRKAAREFIHGGTR